MAQKKRRKKNSPCFVCRSSSADAQFKQKNAARKDGLKIQLEGKVIGTLFKFILYNAVHGPPLAFSPAGSRYT